MIDAAVQDVIVTLVALASAASLVWRLASLVRPRRDAAARCTGCASCPAPSAAKPERQAPAVHPVVWRS